MESPAGNVVQGASNLQPYHPITVGSLEATSDIAKINSLKGELYKYTVQDMWQSAKPIYDEDNEMVHIPLTASGDTALHVAASANSISFVEELVKLPNMNPQDLETPNIDGNTAFCVAAITGHGELFQIMIQKNEKLPEILGQDGLLPVHLGALYGNHKIVEDLISKNLENMKKADIEKLFFMTINSGMYDMAMKLVKKYSKDLIVARFDTGERMITALHMLVQMQKPSEQSYVAKSLVNKYSKYFFVASYNIGGKKTTSQNLMQMMMLSEKSWDSNEENSSGCGDQLELLKELWFHVTHELEHKDIVELITSPSMMLFDAVKSGNDEAVKWLLSTNPELLLTMKDPTNGRNIMHIAVLYQRYNIVYFILKMETRVLKPIIRAVDNKGNNVLHLVSHQPQETSSSLTPSEKMLTEFKRFKALKMRVPFILRSMKNKDGKRPIDILNASQESLCEQVMKKTTENANTSIVVAVLVTSMAIASALTVPGDKYGSGYASFILLNGFALMLSATSIVVFLTLFTRSSLTSKSVRSAQLLLISGQGFLFYSIIVMIAAFITASFSLYDRTNKKFQDYKYLVLVMGVLPIGMSFGIMTTLYVKGVEAVVLAFTK